MKFAMTQGDEGHSSRQDIIASIIDRNYPAFESILMSDPLAANSKETRSQMNAAMLCVHFGLETFFDTLVEQAGHCLDYAHVDEDGDDLQMIAMRTFDPKLIRAVEAAYSQYAKHIVNNWPAPEA